MEAKYIGIAFLILAILLLLLGIVLVTVRIEKCKRKVRQMAMTEKVQILNELAEPFGFFYQRKEDVFTSQLDAWQRKQGYMALYDKAAASAGMVIDAWPTYFDYEGRTWLIEFWKGQYGINTGGEIGIYHADEIVSPYFYRTAHYDAAENSEMPQIYCYLEKKGEKIYELCAHHWWLTGFRMGLFSKPKDLCMMASLTFEETEMAQAFFDGLLKTGQPRNKFRICCNEVCVRVDFSRKVALIWRLQRKVVQIWDRMLCWLYRAASWPFTDTVDRLIYFYYMVPFFFRRMLRCGRGCRKKQRNCKGR